MSAPLTPDIYQALLNERFTACALDGSGGEFQMTLTAVKLRIDNEEQFAFSVLFLPEGDIQPQGNFRVHHPRAGEFTLFLVPTRQRQTSPIYYEAGFSLLKDEAQ